MRNYFCPYTYDIRDVVEKKMNPTYRFIRPLARQAFVKFWPGPIKASKRLVVVGMPRSGTSWLAKALSLCDGVSYYFEPDQRLGKRYKYRYLVEDIQDQNLEQHIEKSFHGRISDEYTIAEQSFRDILLHPHSSTVLVKWVRLCVCLDWIAKTFPEIKVVQIIRHPVPLFLSWRARGWEPENDLWILLRQKRLMQGPLLPYVSIMNDAKTYWEKAGALWGAVTFMQWKAHRQDWIFKPHEWYCYDPEKRIYWLAKKLGLVWNRNVNDFLQPDRRIIKGPGYGERRDPRSEICKWIGRITPNELHEINSVTQKFNLPFFKNLHPESLNSDPLIIEFNSDIHAYSV